MVGELKLARVVDQVVGDQIIAEARSITGPRPAAGPASRRTRSQPQRPLPATSVAAVGAPAGVAAPIDVAASSGAIAASTSAICPTTARAPLPVVA
jgi:hypothetical protein